MPTTILLRGGTASEWTTADPVLAFREVGLETDTERKKVGDGSTAWSNLPYYDQGLSAALDAAATDDLLGVAADGTVKKIDSGTFAKAFTGVRAVRSSNQQISDSTFEAVKFEAADDWDTDDFHDPSTNPSRVTVPTGKAGKYRLMGYAVFNNASGGRRIGELEKNGTTTLMRHEADHAATHTLLVAGDFDLADGDYVELLAYQTSGGALDLAPSYGGMFLIAERLGD